MSDEAMGYTHEVTGREILSDRVTVSSVAVHRSRRVAIATVEHGDGLVTLRVGHGDDPWSVEKFVDLSAPQALAYAAMIIAAANALDDANV